MTSETFEQVLSTAQAAGSLTAAWKKFVNTRFFVAIERSADNDPKNFALHLRDSEGKPAVTISEVRERIDPAHGHPLVAMSGADVVRRLREGSILVALSEGAFSISSDRAEWLKQGIEAAHARAADKARQAAPAPVALEKKAAAPAPSTPVQRNQVGVLDVAALKPRSVALAKIGLEFFVPGDWTESATAAGLRFADGERRTTLEASGFHRPGLSMAQWMDMRMTLVRHEMGYLTQDGDAYPFDGELWRGRVQGMATEFTGTFPGDDGPSRYLVACIWTDGVLASIAIRAPQATFEANRALYKWLLGRVDMNQTAATIYSAPASLGEADWDDGDGDTAPMFAFSLAGRMGRARVLAYTFPMGLVAGLVGILAAVLLPVSKVLGGIVVAAAVGVLCWFCVRLMVLRMHDINLSGKWLLGTLGVLIVAGATQNMVLLGVASLVFWLGSLVIYCFIPGTNGDNDYGAPPGPNSLLVNIGAGLFILLQLAQIGALSSGKYADRFALPNLRANAKAAPAEPFTMPDVSFSVMLPGVPREIKPPPAMASQLGDVALRQYGLEAGGVAYVLQSINYFDRMPDNRFDAMDGMQESVLGKDGTLVESRPILLKGTTGRQVKVGLPGGGMRAARFAVVGSTFSMIIVTSPDAVKDARAIDAFLNSFKLH